MISKEQKRETMRLVMGKPYVPAKERKPNIFTKFVPKLTYKFYSVKNNIIKKITNVKNKIKDVKDNIFGFFQQKKRQYAAFCIENFHPEKTVIIRNQYIALKDNGESFSEFLRRRGENQIYVKLVQKNKFKKETNKFKIFLNFISIFKKESEADDAYFNNIKSKLKQKFLTEVSLLSTMESRVYHNPMFKKDVKKYESVYSGLDEESFDWCFKLKDWETKAIQKNIEHRKTKGMSLVDYLLYKDRVVGRTVVGE